MPCEMRETAVLHGSKSKCFSLQSIHQLPNVPIRAVFFYKNLLSIITVWEDAL